MPRFSSAAASSFARISAWCSLGIVLRGEVGVRERESEGMVSGYVGGRMTCRENCAGVSGDCPGVYEDQVCRCRE
jgi:hypothetical protein